MESRKNRLHHLFPEAVTSADLSSLSRVRSWPTVAGRAVFLNGPEVDVDARTKQSLNDYDRQVRYLSPQNPRSKGSKFKASNRDTPSCCISAQYVSTTLSRASSSTGPNGMLFFEPKP